MNPSAIYSKSGKGVQEAGGKTSHLSRPDRAVLSAIDGRATLADVAQKVGKAFDPAFEKLIEALDKGGFIREVSPGQPVAKPAAPAKPGAKPGATAPMDAASDLDFTASITAPSKGGRPPPPPQAPPRAAPPPPRPKSAIPPAPPPPSAAEKAKAADAAKEQQDAMAKAREEAERKAAAERDRVKAEAEAKMRSETEAKIRAEADLKAKEAEAKIKAAQEAAARAAAEAKAKADAEAKKAREEAERAKKEAEAEAKRAREEAERARKEAEAEAKRAREEAERARKEAEEKVRREQEELKRKLDEERKKFEEERKRHEEAKRREEEERASRRIQEERERVERRRQEKEEEERAAKRRARDEEVEEEKPKAKPKPPPEPAKPAPSGGFSDSLLADLESFTNREESEAKERDEAERKAKEEAARRAREAEERRVKEEAERREREEKEREKRREKEEAAARKAAEERSLREKEEREKERLKEEEEKRKKEAEEREKKAKQEERLAAKSTGAGAAGYSEEEQLRRRRERQLGPAPHSPTKERAARGGWGKPIAIALFLLVVVAVGVAHIMPIDVADYRQAAEDALGQPVKIGSARLSLISGLQLKFNDVVVGETRIAEVRAFPEFDALTGPRKRFSRIEIDGLKLDQQAFGAAVFAKARGDNFNVQRVVVKQLELVGPLVFPKGLEIDALLDHEGIVRAATVRGPDALLAKVNAKEGAMDLELSAANFAMPFAPEVTLSKFSMKGTATPRGLSISEWDGQALNGNVSGTANIRWGDTWAVDGVLTARNIYAAVFAPALLSEGRGEGSAKFSMRGEPGKLAAGTHLDGNFTVTNGSLGSIDLSRAIQTGGKQATGRTQFKEMNGHAVYDRGTVAVRNVIINAGQLNAGASADIAQNGALSGRIVADVRVSSQTLRATLNLGGTLKEPQVRN